MTTYAPVRETTKFPADTLYGAAKDAVDQLGYRPAAADAPAFTLDTREQSVAISSIPRLSYKYSFHIETAGGVLVLTAACTKNSATSEQTFADCGDERPDRVVREQGALKARILEIAPRVASNTPDWSNFEKPEVAADAGAPAEHSAHAAKSKNAGKAKTPPASTPSTPSTKSHAH